MSSEKKVRVTVEACGEVRSFECRCATVTAINGNGSGDACFVGAADPVDIATRPSARWVFRTASRASSCSPPC